MADSDGDKTEAATPRRRQEAREEGNIARSQDLVAAALLVGVFLLLKSFGPNLLAAMKAVVERGLSAEALGDLRAADPRHGVLLALVPVALAAAPLLGGVMLLAVAVNLAQVGLFFNFSRLAPDWGHVNPLRNFANLFGGKGRVHLLMNLAKLLLVGWVAWSAVRGKLEQIVATQQLPYVQVLAVGGAVVYSIAMRLAVLLLVLALIDYGYTRFHLERSLRMTKDEVKREMRQMDGDPEIKRRRRQIAVQAAKKRLATTVPTADVVVTNPTHFAVALKYDEGAMNAPRVVAKGQDQIARRIRELAIENGIPILERPPMARALFQLCQVGQEIPEQFYSAVAEILAYVYELSGRARRSA